MKFEISAIDIAPYDFSLKHSFTADTLDDVLMFMNSFLKGCGYIYDGSIGIVDLNKVEDVYTNDELSSKFEDMIEKVRQHDIEVLEKQERENIYIKNGFL
jgi:hypothetical protein